MFDRSMCEAARLQQRSSDGWPLLLGPTVEMLSPVVCGRWWVECLVGACPASTAERSLQESCASTCAAQA